MNDLLNSLYLIYTIKGYDIDNLILFIINNIIDNYVEKNIDTSCELYKICKLQKDLDDLKKVSNGEPTSDNALSCFLDTVFACKFLSADSE